MRGRVSALSGRSVVTVALLPDDLPRSDSRESNARSNGSSRPGPRFGTLMSSRVPGETSHGVSRLCRITAGVCGMDGVRREVIGVTLIGGTPDGRKRRVAERFAGRLWPGRALQGWHDAVRPWPGPARFRDRPPARGRGEADQRAAISRAASDFVAGCARVFGARVIRALRYPPSPAPAVGPSSDDHLPATARGRQAAPGRPMRTALPAGAAGHVRPCPRGPGALRLPAVVARVTARPAKRPRPPPGTAMTTRPCRKTDCGGAVVPAPAPAAPGPSPVPASRRPWSAGRPSVILLDVVPEPC